MTTTELINLIRANQSTLTHRVLVEIADRLEAQELAMSGMVASMRAMDRQLMDMHGRVADVERLNQGLTLENRELRARCDLLNHDLFGSEKQVREACVGLARIMFDLDQLRLEMELTD